MFSATPEGASASANIYSLVETAKANGLEPFEYLNKVFKKLPMAQTEQDFLELLPVKIES
jgi:transposase